MNKKMSWGLLILFICSFLWGSTFVAQKESVGVLGEWMYTGLRFILGAIIVFPFTLKITYKQIKSNENVEKPVQLILYGICCGLLLALASILQQKGVITTDIGKAAFLTGLYSVLVPIVAFILFKEKSTIGTYLGVAFSLVGLYLLCNVSSLKLRVGDLYLIGSALTFSFQIVFIGHFSKKVNPLRLAFVQMMTCGLVCIFISLFIEDNNQFYNIIKCWGPLLYAGILSCGVAYTFQVVGQKLCGNATISTLVMSLEAPVSSICQVVYFSIFMTTNELIGCSLMFMAIILSQIDIISLIKKLITKNQVNSSIDE